MQIKQTTVWNKRGGKQNQREHPKIWQIMYRCTRRPKEQKMWQMYKECTRTWPVNPRQIQPLLVHSLYMRSKQFMRNVSVSYLVCYTSCTFQQHITGKLMSKTCLMKKFFTSLKIHNSIPLRVPVIPFLLCIHVSERPFKVPNIVMMLIYYDCELEVI